MREEECEAIENRMCGLLEVQWVGCCDCVIDADFDLGFRGLQRRVQLTKKWQGQSSDKLPEE